jgi:glycosyltransferase involved in cell wall biosynthesis
MEESNQRSDQISLLEEKPQMRILQIATSSSGGAGIAATRLVELLSAQGVQTKLITRDSVLPGSYLKKGNLRKILGKFITLFQSKILANDYDLVTPISIGQKVVSDVQAYCPDLIHIHNWYNLLSLDEIVILGKEFPLVFTLHDERLITGGCHITLGCEKFKIGCTNCPAVNHGKSLIARSFVGSVNAFSKIERLGIVAPSNWLIAAAKLAPVLNSVANFKVIPNVVSNDTSEIQVPESRNRGSSLNLLFVAADLSAKVKDLHIAINAVNLFSLELGTGLIINLKVVGANLPNDLIFAPNIQFEFHSYLSENELKGIFRKSDALLITSRSENSPNIIAEAQLNGLVVIATEVGGIPELIDDGLTGFLSDTSAEGIAKAISAYVHSNTEEIRRLAFDSAKSRWDSEHILKDHLDFYTRVLES